jgi:hypothetical protein
VTFGSGSSYTPLGTKQAFVVLVSLFLGIGGFVFQKNQRLNNEEAHQKELNIAVSKLSNATHGGIKGAE